MEKHTESINNQNNGPQPTDSFTSAVSASRDQKLTNQKSVEQDKQKRKLGDYSNAHAASAPIYARKINIEEVKLIHRENPLSHFDVQRDIQLFNLVINKNEIPENLEEIINVLVDQYQQGNQLEVIKGMKSIAKSKENLYQVLKYLLESLGTKTTGFFNQAKSSLQDISKITFYQAVMSQDFINLSLTKEQRQSLSDKLAAKQPQQLLKLALTGYKNLTDVARVAVGGLDKAKKIISDDTKQLVSMAQKLSDKKEVATTELLEFQQMVEKTATILRVSKNKIMHLKKRGKEQEAEELNNIILTMESALENFMNLADQYKQGLSDQTKLDLVEKIQAGAEKFFMQNCQLVANHLRRRAGEGVIIALDRDVLDMVNNSLISLGDAQLDVELFGEADSLELSDLQEFFQGNYELLNEINNLDIAYKYVYHETNSYLDYIKEDNQERVRLRDKKLADDKEVEKFLEEFQQKMKEELKKITKIEHYKAIEVVRFNINNLKNIIKDLIKNNSGNLLWYQSQLDLARQKEVARIISDLNINVQ